MTAFGCTMSPAANGGRDRAIARASPPTTARKSTSYFRRKASSSLDRPALAGPPRNADRSDSLWDTMLTTTCTRVRSVS